MAPLKGGSVFLDHELLGSDLAEGVHLDLAVSKVREFDRAFKGVAAEGDRFAIDHQLEHFRSNFMGFHKYLAVCGRMPGCASLQIR